KRGEATLIDWGIARDLEAPGDGEHVLRDEAPSASGRMVTISAGTPPYLPLEQTQGRAADPSFDVYSFGVTLYEVVAGRTPFEWVAATTPGARSKQLETFLTWLKSGDDAPPAMARDPELSGIIARARGGDEQGERGREGSARGRRRGEARTEGDLPERRGPGAARCGRPQAQGRREAQGRRRPRRQARDRRRRGLAQGERRGRCGA